MFLIGIAGPSCAGKGCLCDRLAEEFSAQVLPIDSYYRPLDHLTLEERGRVNFDEPQSLDEELLVDQLASLRAGHPIERPVYDFARHTRAAQSVTVLPTGYILIEGLFTLHWERVRAMLDASIFITAADNICFARRLERDQRERGRTAESVKTQYDATVAPMREEWIEPTARYAGLVLDGSLPIDENAQRAAEFLRSRLAEHDCAAIF